MADGKRKLDELEKHLQSTEYIYGRLARKNLEHCWLLDVWLRSRD